MRKYDRNCQSVPKHPDYLESGCGFPLFDEPCYQICDLRASNTLTANTCSNGAFSLPLAVFVGVVVVAWPVGLLYYKRPQWDDAFDWAVYALWVALANIGFFASSSVGFEVLKRALVLLFPQKEWLLDEVVALITILQTLIENVVRWALEDVVQEAIERLLGHKLSVREQNWTKDSVIWVAFGVSVVGFLWGVWKIYKLVDNAYKARRFDRVEAKSSRLGFVSPEAMADAMAGSALYAQGPAVARAVTETQVAVAPPPLTSVSQKSVPPPARLPPPRQRGVPRRSGAAPSARVIAHLYET